MRIFPEEKDEVLDEPGNPERLARENLLLLNDPDLRQKMGQKAHEKVLRRFTISSTVGHVERIYEEMCQK